MKNNREFNFRQDVQAVRELYESKVKLTVIPCKNVASNLKTSIYELEHFLKGKNEVCDYLCQRFYNDTYHGIQERRVIWDISVIAYMINKTCFETEEVSCPIIKEDTSYELSENRHKVTFVNYLDKRYEKLTIMAFIFVSTCILIFIGKPATLLIVAGSVNGLILPVTLAVMLLATRKTNIVGDYKHNPILFYTGWIVVLVTAYIGVTSLQGIAKLLG